MEEVLKYKSLFTFTYKYIIFTGWQDIKSKSINPAISHNLTVDFKVVRNHYAFIIITNWLFTWQSWVILSVVNNWQCFIKGIHTYFILLVYEMKEIWMQKKPPKNPNFYLPTVLVTLLHIFSVHLYKLFDSGNLILHLCKGFRKGFCHGPHVLLISGNVWKTTISSHPYQSYDKESKSAEKKKKASLFLMIITQSEIYVKKKKYPFKRTSLNRFSFYY